jgi:16S rRNA (cytosine967-C5)-methyltransferase
LRAGLATPLREVERATRELDPRDRALVRKLVGTEQRRRGTLRAISHHIQPRALGADLAAHLHVALVQIFFLDRVPEHAVRSEMLDAVRRTLGPSRVRLARELLDAAYALRAEGRSGDPRRDLVRRNVHLAEAVFHDPSEHPLLWAEDALSMPAAIMKRWSARFGEERARELAEFALEEPPLSVRVVRGARDEIAQELGDSVRPGAHADVLLAPASEAEHVTASAAFARGAVTIQGESALRAAEALGAREGEELLDLCAAPGGKTAVLAASGACVVACDVSDEKLARVDETLARLGLLERVELARGDAEDALGTRTFDGVLVDAPCTNTGVLAQRPEARWRFGPDSKRALVELQTQLFDRGAARVRSGGRLVWSTCALDADENRRAVDAFLARHAGWELELDAEALPDTATTQTAGAGPVDGGYYALLRRVD